MKVGIVLMLLSVEMSGNRSRHVHNIYIVIMSGPRKGIFEKYISSGYAWEVAHCVLQHFAPKLERGRVIKKESHQNVSSRLERNGRVHLQPLTSLESIQFALTIVHQSWEVKFSYFKCSGSEWSLTLLNDNSSFISAITGYMLLLVQTGIEKHFEILSIPFLGLWDTLYSDVFRNLCLRSMPQMWHCEVCHSS